MANVSLVDGHIDGMTNYDRIRNMSVEELAKFIPDWSYTKACKCDEEIYAGCNNECWKCVKEWLESGVDTE
jgi:hypothetical protein